MIKKNFLIIICCFLIYLFFSGGFILAHEIQLSPQDVQWIAQKIFKNECAEKDDKLVWWNDGEDFISLGIGHFIWYPHDQKGPFVESFLDFLDYAQAAGYALPDWLSVHESRACPWRTKDDFVKGRESREVRTLYNFLNETKTIQADFIIARLNNALPLILKNIPDHEQQKIARMFFELTRTKSGIYAVADYMNFKGLGIAPGEIYQGKGWGLRQVLLRMDFKDTPEKTVQEFARCAAEVLSERVNNSPPERNEKRWLTGWQRRVLSYLDTD